MSLLTYSQVDTSIQQRMANRAPSSTRRLQAINDAMQDIYTDFDVASSRRKVVAYIVPDGSPVKFSSIIEDDDYKKISDVRYLGSDKHDDEFSYRDDDKFMVNIGQGRKLNEYTDSFIDGELFFRLNSENGFTSALLHNAESLTDNGTWSADTTNSDATNITTTSTITVAQSNAIEFDVDVSQSVNNYALIELVGASPVDLSDYVALGRARMRIYIPSTTNLTSISLRWGSDSSNYNSLSVNTQIDGSALQVGWNELEFDWASTSLDAPTGSPDNSAIDYLAVQINYNLSYADQKKFRIEKIEMYLPAPFEIFYYTYFVSKDNSGNMQVDLTATSTDKLLLPVRYKTLVVSRALYYLWPMALGDDGEKLSFKAEKDYLREAKKLGYDIGNRVKMKQRKVKLKGI